MDAKVNRRGRLTGADSHSTDEIPLRQCRYCKGQFRPLPKNVDKQTFCCESHRKMFWRYGAQSIGKVAARIERDMRKLVAREQRPLLAELMRLRARVDALENARGLAGAVTAERDFERDVLNAGGGAAA